jgi:hypothetical protein
VAGNTAKATRRTGSVWSPGRYKNLPGNAKQAFWASAGRWSLEAFDRLLPSETRGRQFESMA